jgi:hypothetical protein
MISSTSESLGVSDRLSGGFHGHQKKGSNLPIKEAKEEQETSQQKLQHIQIIDNYKWTGTGGGSSILGRDRNALLIEEGNSFNRITHNYRCHKLQKLMDE